jgi:hypothetical protein
VTDRRSLLLASAGGLATLAGCLSGDSDSEDPDDDPENNSQDQTPGGGENGSDNGGDSGGENGGDNGGENGSDNGGDNGGENGDENGGDNGSENGGDSGGDNGSDTGGENGGDNGGDNGGENGGDNGSENGTALTFSEPRVGSSNTEPTLLSETVAPASVAVTNEQTTFISSQLSLAVVPTDSESPVATHDQDLVLTAGETRRLSFSDVTSELDPGTYELAFSAKASATSTSLEIAGREPGEVTITVYGKTVADGNEVDSALLTITDGDTEVTTTDVTGDGSVTLSLPLAETRSYTAEFTNVNQSSLPDTTTEFTVEEGSQTVDVVAGYPFNAKNTYRFRHYLYLPEAQTDEGKGATELLAYGEYARGGKDYHIRHITGQLFGREPIPPQGEIPVEYGDDLATLSEQRNLGAPGHSVQVGLSVGKGYFHTESRNQWERVDRAYGYMTSIAGGATELDIYAEPEEREFVGTDTVQGTTVDVFLIDDGWAREYVNPETGYTLRSETLYNNERDTYEVVEFFGYEQNLEALDWAFIKDQTSDVTGPDTDVLPWNAETRY